MPKLNPTLLRDTKQLCLCPPAQPRPTPEFIARLSISPCCPKRRCRTGASQHHGGDVMGQGCWMGHGQGRGMCLQGGIGGPVPGAFLVRP